MKKTGYIYLVVALFVHLSLGAQQRYTLDECHRMALEQNAQMKIAVNKTRIATQEKREAVTGFLPSVSLSGGAMKANEGLIQMPMGGQTMEMVDDGLFGGAMVSLPLFAGGRVYNAHKLTKLGEVISELQLRQTQNEVILTVDQYYWNMVVLDAKLQTLERVEALLKKICSDVEVAVSAGVKNRNDLLQVELRRGETQSLTIDVRGQMDICRMLLAQFVGCKVDEFDVETTVDTLLLSPDHFYVEHETALHGTVECQLLDRAVDASKLEKSLNSGQFLPTVALNGGFMYNDFMGPSQNSFVGMVNVSIPISWKAPYSLKKYKYRYQNTVTQRDNGREQLMIGMQKARLDLDNAYQQVLIARHSIAQSEENLRLNESYYKAGTSSISDLLEAQQLFQQSRDKYAEAYSQYEISKTKYLQATGR